jgi:hypothetical protein
MEKLAEAVAAYLCRHGSVGLLLFTLDLTRRRLDLFAEIGAVEVVKGTVVLPAPSIDAWWQAAVREAVRYARGPVRAGDRQLDRSAEKRPKRPSAPPAA